jgi:hypothetical protein
MADGNGSSEHVWPTGLTEAQSEEIHLLTLAEVNKEPT